MPHTDACSPTITNYELIFISPSILNIPTFLSSLLTINKKEFGIGEEFGDVDANHSVCNKKRDAINITSLLIKRFF